MCGCNSGATQASVWIVIKNGQEVFRGDQVGAQSYAVINGGLARKAS